MAAGVSEHLDGSTRLLLQMEPDLMLVLVLVEDPGQTPSRIPENSESCRTLMDDPVALSTNTDTYSPAWR